MGVSRSCILLYLWMLEEFVPPNGYTFPSVVRACCLCDAAEEGKQVHAHVMKFGFGTDGFSLNNLIQMYVNFQFLEEARRVFDRMPQRDVLSWTALISGFSQCGFVDEAFELFELMPDRNSVSWNAMIASYAQSNRFPEAFSLFRRMEEEKVSLAACTGLGALDQGKWIYGFI